MTPLISISSRATNAIPPNRRAVVHLWDHPSLPTPSEYQRSSLPRRDAQPQSPSPGANVSSTIRALSFRDQRRRPSQPAQNLHSHRLMTLKLRLNGLNGHTLRELSRLNTQDGAQRMRAPLRAKLALIRQKTKHAEAIRLRSLTLVGRDALH